MTGHAWVTYGLLLVVSVVLLGVQIWNAVAPGGAHESPLCNDDSNCTRGMMLADGTCEQWLLGRSEPCHDRCMRRESRSGFCNAQGKCVANWTDSLGYCVSHEDAGCDAVFQLDANFWGAGAPYYAQEHIVDYQAQCEYNQCVAYAQGVFAALYASGNASQPAPFITARPCLDYLNQTWLARVRGCIVAERQLLDPALVTPEDYPGTPTAVQPFLCSYRYANSEANQTAITVGPPLL